MFRIGRVEINHPFMLAALSGYSDLPMRRIARRFGASYAVNEVVLDRCVVHPGAWQERLLTVAPDDHPVGAQLMGENPEDFGPAAARLAQAGYDVIDLNFGCPAPKVVGRCRGGHLLAEPHTALAIIDRVVDAVGRDRPVTVKMRRGIDDGPASVRHFHAILDGALARGVAAVTIHGRTVTQRYSGRSDRRFLAEVKRRAGGAVVIGSGDLLDGRACVEMLEATGVDGVSIARGAIGNPWIFRDCLALAAGAPLPSPPDLTEQRRVLEAHFAEVCAHHGARAGRIFLKDAIKYARHHPHGRELRVALQQVKTADALRALIAQWYGRDERAPAPEVNERRSLAQSRDRLPLMSPSDVKGKGAVGGDNPHPIRHRTGSGDLAQPRSGRTTRRDAVVTLRSDDIPTNQEILP